MKFRNVSKVLLLIFLAWYVVHLLDGDDRLFYWWQDENTPEVVKEHSLWLPDFHVEVEAFPIPGVENNASGITYAKDRDSLVLIVNNPQRLIELDKNFQILRKVSLSGFADPEGVAYAGPDKLLVIDEREQSVVMLPLKNWSKKLEKKDFPQLTLNTGGENNKGFEGVAANIESGDIFVVRERDPKRLLKISGFLEEENAIEITEIEAPIKHSLYFDDLSGLHFSDKTKSLLMLSDESQVLAELKLDGDVISFMDLEEGFNGLQESIPQAEGVALDEKNNLYIVSEPNLLYRYKANSGQN